MQGQAIYIEGFKQWLALLGYVESSVYYDHKRLGEFFEWLEGQGIDELGQVNGKLVESFFEALRVRKSQRSGEPLAENTLRGYLKALRRFVRYLHYRGEAAFDVPVQLPVQEKREIVVLSQAEIRRLYEATDGSLLGLRDRAMLALCYGCGLRRNEALRLQIGDFLPEKHLLHVSKGKGHRSRYVPLIGSVSQDLSQYLTLSRPVLAGEKPESACPERPKGVEGAFLLSLSGKPLHGNSLYERFKRLMRLARIERPAGLHSLRHSIATHLLQNGMSLHQISAFLGHTSLQSTQRYTHVG